MLRHLRIGPRPRTVVRAGDDHGEIGNFRREDAECVEEKIQSLLHVQPSQKENERPIAELRELRAKLPRRRQRFDFFGEDSVGNDFAARQLQRLDQSRFIGIERMNKRRVPQRRPVRHRHRQFLLPLPLRKRPRIEHPRRPPAVGDGVALRGSRGGDEQAFPHAVDVNEIQARNNLVQHAPCDRREVVFVARQLRQRNTANLLNTRHARDRPRNAFLGGGINVSKNRNVMPQRPCAAANRTETSGGPPLAGSIVPTT